MKKEHYAYISERFNLKQYHGENGPHTWSEKREGSLFVSEIACAEWCSRTYCIRGYENGRPQSGIFLNIPSKELAEEILQCIKDTEIMFI